MPKPRIYEATPEALAALPVTSDREMARTFGGSANTWSRIRKRHGIARFRNPTTLGGVPQPWVEPKPKSEYVERLPPVTIQTLVPKPDTSLAGEAASFLRRMRFPNVYNRAKVLGKDGWQVAGNVLSEAAMIAKAERLGFQRASWMG